MILVTLFICVRSRPFISTDISRKKYFLKVTYILVVLSIVKVY